MPPYKSHERLMIVVLKAAPRLKVIVINWVVPSGKRRRHAR